MLAWLALFTALASDAHQLHASLYEASQRAEAAGEYAQAYAHCEDAIAVWPTGPRATTCDSRLRWMRARRDADGGFETLKALQAVRAKREELSPQEARRRVSALLASEGNAPTLRAEIELWLAHQGLAQGTPPEQILRWTQSAWERREELPRTVRLDATLTHARTLALAGRIDEAKAVEAEARVARNTTRNTPVEAVAQAQQRTRWAHTSLVGLAMFVLASAPSAYRAGRQNLRGALPGLSLIWLSVAAAWVLASAWEPRAGTSLPAFAVMASLLHLLSRAALRSGAWPAWPIRLGAGFATLCAGYLSLYHFNAIDWVVP